MPKPHRYRSRWKNPTPTEAKLWSPIREGVKTRSVWKVFNGSTGFYWTGRANHLKFYDQEGESWSSKEDASAAVMSLVSKAGDSDFSIQRLGIRLKEIRAWEIIECKVRVTKLGDGHNVNLVEYEVLNEVFKQGRTVGNVFARAVENGTSENIQGLIHLDSYVNAIQDTLDRMSIPEDKVVNHRTVLEVRDLKWLMFLKLSLTGVKAALNVHDIRELVSTGD
jgi:hypothetical protein